MSHGQVNGFVVHWSPGLLVLVMLALSVGAAGQEDRTSLPEALYFENYSPITESYNLTSYPPSANASGTSLQFISEGNEAVLTWTIAALPAAWNVSSRSLSTATLFLSGLDEVLPVPPQDPARAAATAGRIEIRVRVVDPSLQPLVEGSVLFQPQPVQPRDEIFEMEVPLRASEDASVSPAEDNDSPIIFVHVSGRNMTGTNVSPVHMHLGSSETPARLELDDFPYAAYRAWEEAEDERRAQNDEILRTGNRKTMTPSPTETIEGTGTQSEPSPGLAGIVVVLACFALAAGMRRRLTAG